MIQMPSIVVVLGRSRMIVGSEIRTLFESSNAMNVPIVVFVSTTYLYCIGGHRGKAAVDRRVLMYLRPRLQPRSDRIDPSGERLPRPPPMRPHATKGLSSRVLLSTR